VSIAKINTEVRTAVIVMTARLDVDLPHFTFHIPNSTFLNG
jgi:hypothetical protein